MAATISSHSTCGKMRCSHGIVVDYPWLPPPIEGSPLRCSSAADAFSLIGRLGSFPGPAATVDLTSDRQGLWAEETQLRTLDLVDPGRIQHAKSYFRSWRFPNFIQSWRSTNEENETTNSRRPIGRKGLHEFGLIWMQAYPLGPAAIRLGGTIGTISNQAVAYLRTMKPDLMCATCDDLQM